MRYEFDLQCTSSGENNWRCDFRSMVNIYGFLYFHFTTVSESGFPDPGHNHYHRLIFIMPFSAPSHVSDFLFWSIFSYCIPIFFLSSTGVFPLKIAPKTEKTISKYDTVHAISLLCLFWAPCKSNSTLLTWKGGLVPRGSWLIGPRWFQSCEGRMCFGSQKCQGSKMEIGW